jgi:endonuclease/exonuclease/phosphatase family metal-dependent hydrolase
MKVWKIVLILVLIPLLYIGGQILYGTLTDYRPADIMRLRVNGKAVGDLKKDTVDLYIWNIGYAGLGRESDFFLDGGQHTRVSSDLTAKNLDGIKSTIAGWEGADFILLQEVDEDARRSFGVNQFQEINDLLGENYGGVLAFNYVVKFVPVPLFKPYGRVRAGLATYTPYKADSIDRYQFPGNYAWPRRIYFLDRCFMVMRIPYKERELLVINTHNSAYDDGTLKAEQMKYLRDFITAEYEKGNYVVVGGDWNQCPPEFECYGDFDQEEVDYEQNNIDRGFMPEGWQWSYDPDVMTNRKLAAPYQPGKTYTTVIDFYLTSPNITVLSVEGQDLDFDYSDHQPVRLQVRLDG